MFDFLMALILEHTRFGEKLLDQSTAAADRDRRKAWVRSRLWHNGKHANCCRGCFQAGYVMALLRAGRLDLLAEYPELIRVYEDLQRDGYLNTQAPFPFSSRPPRAASRALYRM